MQAVYFDGAGFKAEKLAATQFNGTLVTDLQQQYKDIDVMIKAKDGSLKSVSVKDQLWSSEKFGSIQVELKTINTRTGVSQNGCFYTNESDYYFWRIWTKDFGDTWAVIEASVLKDFVKQNLDTLKTWNTTAKTEEKNRSYGRRYDRTEGVVLKTSDLMQLGKLIPVKGTKN